MRKVKIHTKILGALEGLLLARFSARTPALFCSRIWSTEAPQFAFRPWLLERDINHYATVQKSTRVFLEWNIETCGVQRTSDDCRYLQPGNVPENIRGHQCLPNINQTYILVPLKPNIPSTLNCWNHSSRSLCSHFLAWTHYTTVALRSGLSLYQRIFRDSHVGKIFQFGAFFSQYKRPRLTGRRV